jgi:hypothetical protein
MRRILKIAARTTALGHTFVESSIVLGCLLMIGLLTACSSANPPASNGTANLPASQVSVSAAPESRGVGAINTASPSSAPGNASGQEHLVGIGSATIVTIHGKIVTVDRAKKLVTLEGPGGKLVTLYVYNPYNLAAAKVGEPFVAKFYEIVTIRKKQLGEVLPIASVAEGIVSAMPGQTPGAVLGTRREMIVTVDAIDLAKETATVKGPDGVGETITVANPGNLEYVKAGEQIVVTLSNVVAIALEKDSGV